MIELLKLCGFEADEAESELPRMEKAFNKLGITAEDIGRAKQRLTKYYDIELKGVRKLLRLLVQDIVNSVLAREEGKTKIIYGFMSPGWTPFVSALVSKSKEVHATYLCPQFQIVVGGIFNKMVPILEAAEKRWLKAGAVTHCSNVKSLVGLFALDLIPKPDLLITSGLLCETAPKTTDLLHELYNIPTYSINTCHDREYSEYPAATKRIVGLAAQSLRRLTERVQEAVGFEITGDMLREEIDASSELARALSKLDSLIESSDPLPVSANHQILWRFLGLLPLSTDSMADAIDAINTLYEELQERVDKGLGVVEKGTPRILALLPPSHVDPRPDHLVSELGMAIVASDFGCLASDVGIPQDPYEIVALQALQDSPFHSLRRRIPLIIELCKRLNIDGVIDRFHIGCRTVVGDALLIKEAITKELGIPVLLLERDDFDPRPYNHEQYKRRLEVFKTMLSREHKRSMT